MKQFDVCIKVLSVLLIMIIAVRLLSIISSADPNYRTYIKKDLGAAIDFVISGFVLLIVCVFLYLLFAQIL